MEDFQGKNGGKGRRIRKALLRHACYFAGGIAVLSLWKCPFRLFFGIPCPGCGMTRAFFAFFRGDFSGMMQAHPLFVVTPFLLLYLFHRDVLPRRLPKRAEQIGGIVCILLFFGVYLYRLVFCQDNPVMHIDFPSSLLGRLLY
jgi:hypothetical protein